MEESASPSVLFTEEAERVHCGVTIRYLLHCRSIVMEHVLMSSAWYMRLLCGSASLQPAACSSLPLLDVICSSCVCITTRKRCGLISA
jgi:hypothetical protein